MIKKCIISSLVLVLKTVRSDLVTQRLARDTGSLISVPQQYYQLLFGTLKLTRRKLEVVGGAGAYIMKPLDVCLRLCSLSTAPRNKAAERTVSTMLSRSNAWAAKATYS